MPDSLLKPVVVSDPDPVRVSTFAEPEYAKLTFTYGRDHARSAQWPIYCKNLRITIPTGRRAGQLTNEPELITTSVDCTAFAGRKYDSLAAHASQMDNVFFLDVQHSIATRPQRGLQDAKLFGGCRPPDEIAALGDESLASTVGHTVPDVPRKMRPMLLDQVP